MRTTGVFRLGLVGAMVVSGLLVGMTQATATTAQGPSAPAGTANAGAASINKGQTDYEVAALAPCHLNGSQHGSSTAVQRPGVISFGAATSSCTRNNNQHTSTSTATGRNFKLSLLQSYGGPLIQVADYSVTCAATTHGTNASWRFSGLTGFNVPSNVPNNYTVQIRKSGKVLATVVLNEVILPHPNNGSITMNLMHITLFPQGMPQHNSPQVTGDVYVGTTTCSPVK